MTNEDAVTLIIEEYGRAYNMHGPHPSMHHGYAALLEEVDELWAEIKKKDPDPEALRKEAAQVGAMALRFLVDCCPNDKEGS